MWRRGWEDKQFYHWPQDGNDACRDSGCQKTFIYQGIELGIIIANFFYYCSEDVKYAPYTVTIINDFENPA